MKGNRFLRIGVVLLAVLVFALCGCGKGSGQGGEKELNADASKTGQKEEKLYLIFSDGSNFYSRVLYCPLEDVYKKQGTWTDAYRIQGIITWEESQKYMQNLDLR